MSKRIDRTNLDTISHEWNKVCWQREEVIKNGLDVSLTSVTAPWMISKVKQLEHSRILDIGCGTGYLTYELSVLCDECVAVDVSEDSIEIARRDHNNNNIEYFISNVSDFEYPQKFDICTANMMLMTDPDWINTLKNAYELLYEDGKLLIMITHPCYWPVYWGYFDKPWFDYYKETYIKSAFSTSLSDNMGMSTHIHRPLNMYVDEIQKVGFIIKGIEEPYPLKKVPNEYKYLYPRFLFIECSKEL